MSKKKERENYELLKKCNRIYTRIISKEKIKYAPETHLPLLLKMFAEGKAICDFLYEAEISEDTFHEWRNTRPDFNDAYKMARKFAERWHVKFALENIDNQSFNFKTWSSIMRNRYGWTEHRKLDIPGLKTSDNFLEQYKCLVEELRTGNLTASEANQLSSLILAGVKISESSELLKRVEALEQLGSKR